MRRGVRVGVAERRGRKEAGREVEGARREAQRGQGEGEQPSRLGLRAPCPRRAKRRRGACRGAWPETSSNRALQHQHSDDAGELRRQPLVEPHLTAPTPGDRAEE